MPTSKYLVVLALLLGAGAVSANEGGHAGWQRPAENEISNLPSLQRGARDFMNYCSGCHSMKYLRYNRLGRDLGIPEDQLKASLMFTSDKLGDHIVSSMPKGSGDPTAPSESEKWFGRAPPDLSLSARERGADWIYSYLLTFYLDPGRPSGVNNLMLPGASMPHVLGDLQGWQAKVEVEHGEHGEGHGSGPPLQLVQKGALSAAEYKERVGDLTNFLVYAAEPGRNKRIALGFGVLLFTAIFGVFCYLLKVEYWKDVH